MDIVVFEHQLEGLLRREVAGSLRPIKYERIKIDDVAKAEVCSGRDRKDKEDCVVCASLTRLAVDAKCLDRCEHSVWCLTPELSRAAKRLRLE